MIAALGFGSSAPEKTPTPSRPSGAVHCKPARQAVPWYRFHTHRWQTLRDADRLAGPGPKVRGHSCGFARYAASEWQGRARAARQTLEVWLKERTLTDHGWWRKDVQEVQKVFPGTDGWLMSCASSEGGWGRFVQNSQGADVWGWLQFAPGTFSGFVRHAIADARERGYRVPESAWALDSTLGQALAGGWGITHGMRHHWAGAGCQ